MDISLRDAAKMLNVSESTLSRWINEECLPAFMINGHYRFNRVDLLEWANHRKIPAAALYRLSESADAPCQLASLLEGNIHYDVPGDDKKAVIAAVAERLPLASVGDKALAAQALWDREAKGATIIDGIAIPHARSPLVFRVDRPALSLCFLKKPVSFESQGAAPVRVVWTLVSPTVRAHLAILAKVASALHDAEFRRLLDKPAPETELLACARRMP
ncbi:MAG: PTS sugar transporter subunit IIA [Elusimicrobia bacterium]|nr:PTS sugar transporter subunit IIA [Elusimicrobiota bacterium]